MAVKSVKLPDIGEGIREGEIVRWLVREGDYVKQFQPVVEVLTAKATVEIPTPYEGRVLRLMASEGEEVRVGEPLMEIEVAGEEPETPPGAEEAVAARGEARVVRAPPRVRKLARELGVDLAQVKGTGPGGTITEEDVRRHAESLRARAEAPPVAVEARVERVPLKGIRKTMAERMSEAKRRIPHVYTVEEVDFTELERLRSMLRRDAESKGVKLTYMPFIVKAVVKALKEYPLMNSSLDEERGEVVVKRYYNIGIAVDTPNGLVVPNIKDADRKGLYQIARELSDLAERARRGELRLEEVRDGTFTITNFGAIGGVLAMPIINYPESAILGVPRVVERPVYVGGKLEARKIALISLSFDHRFIEGGYATRFLLEVKRLIEEPIRLLARDEEFR